SIQRWPRRSSALFESSTTPLSSCKCSRRISLPWPGSDMGLLGRLVKNPGRVPLTLQRQDPVGTAPAPQHVIDVRSESEQATMPKIKKSGMYEDMAGNRFYYQEGAPITEAQERELTYAGPRTRRERERALPPPQNTAVPA